MSVRYEARLLGHKNIDPETNAGLVIRRHTEHGSGYVMPLVFRHEFSTKTLRDASEPVLSDISCIQNLSSDNEIRAFLTEMVRLGAKYGIVASPDLAPSFDDLMSGRTVTDHTRIDVA